MKTFVQVELNACFLFDENVFRKIEPPKDDDKQYNAVDVFTGDAWFFEDVDEVEPVTA